MKNILQIIKKNFAKISIIGLFFALSANSGCYEEPKDNRTGFYFKSSELLQK
jgi:hypothetical protein